MTIDVIILSNGKTPELIEMTQKCIDSCHDSETEHEFWIKVFEQTEHEYESAETINYDCPFHYNKLMNIGIALTKHEWICLCNNDLIFHKGWLTECLKYKDKYMSMCPDEFNYGGEPEEGYKVGQRGQFKGQCILTNRKLYDIIGKIDESVNFHCSDHVMVDQIKKAGIKHALIKDAYVEHLVHATLKTCSGEEKIHYCDEQSRIYSESLGEGKLIIK